MEMSQWKGGWDRAAEATDALEDALGAIGAPDNARARLRPVVSGRGTPWVDVGAIPAGLAEKVAEVLRAGSGPAASPMGRPRTS
ncbi:hypothetical protein [Streptomyces sp. CBMA152]|uniref:hypothetical protein n=1 Tax=Streptomyces sp. CBMA152 TaxID=1896312 RepID=UPI0016610585|nr:hypothetical protein [Streptomyces sp. CBMA152]MBD0744838.1 hypothetical protein [Streptomyces sp. CBMA152]